MNSFRVGTKRVDVLSPSQESSLIWKQGETSSSTGSVLVKLAQSGFTREAHKIISLSKTASLVGRDSKGGLPELWDVMGKRRGKDGITRLMAVCIARGPLSSQRARALIHDHSADVKEIDDKGMTALHHALQKSNFPIFIELVQVLLELFPQGLKVRDNNGNLPIHFACSSNSPINVVKLLISTFPEGVREKTERGDLPLHSACMGHASVQLIQLLLDVYPNAAREKNQGGHLPFDLAVSHSFFDPSQSNLDIIKALYNSYPDAASIKTNSSLPLHDALEMNAPFNVIKFLVDVFPQGVRERDFIDNLPLQWACNSGAPLDVVKLLYNEYPDSVKKKGWFGRHPLHLACENRAPRDVILFLFDSFPEAASVTMDGFGMFPLSCLCSSHGDQKIDTIILKILLKAHPPAAYSQTAITGKLALHFAAEKFHSQEALEVLLEAYPEGASIIDSDGDLALHVACRKRDSLKAIKLLLDAYPEGVRVKGKNQKLAIHHACHHACYAHENERKVTIITCLYSLYPESVNELDEDGHPPLFYFSNPPPFITDLLKAE